MKYDFTSIIDRHDMDAIAVDSWGEIPGMAPSAKLPGLIEVLRQDPRRAGSKHEPDRIYHLAYAGLDVSFTVDEDLLTVVAVSEAQG